jgi:hypothetical protein
VTFTIQQHLWLVRKKHSSSGIIDHSLKLAYRSFDRLLESGLDMSTFLAHNKSIHLIIFFLFTCGSPWGRFVDTSKTATDLLSRYREPPYGFYLRSPNGIWAA